MKLLLLILFLFINESVFAKWYVNTDTGKQFWSEFREVGGWKPKEKLHYSYENYGTRFRDTGYTMVPVIPVSDDRNYFIPKKPLEYVNPSTKSWVPSTTTIKPTTTEINVLAEPPPTVIDEIPDSNYYRVSKEIVLSDSESVEVSPDSQPVEIPIDSDLEVQLDSESVDVPPDSELEGVQLDSESVEVPTDSELKEVQLDESVEVSPDSELENVQLDSESVDVPPDSELEGVQLDSESVKVPTDSVLKEVSPDSELEKVQLDSESVEVPTDSELKEVPPNTESVKVSPDSELEEVQLDSESVEVPPTALEVPSKTEEDVPIKTKVVPSKEKTEYETFEMVVGQLVTTENDSTINLSDYDIKPARRRRSVILSHPLLYHHHPHHPLIKKIFVYPTYYINPTEYSVYPPPSYVYAAPNQVVEFAPAPPLHATAPPKGKIVAIAPVHTKSKVVPAFAAASLSPLHAGASFGKYKVSAGL